MPCADLACSAHFCKTSCSVSPRASKSQSMPTSRQLTILDIKSPAGRSYIKFGRRPRKKVTGELENLLRQQRDASEITEVLQALAEMSATLTMDANIQENAVGHRYRKSVQ